MASGQAASDVAMREIYNSGDFSDLTVVCGPYTFNIHKAIVCPRSPYFAKACKENTWKEGHENVISLQVEDNDKDDERNTGKDDPRAVKCMFEFIYLNKYNNGIQTSPEDTSIDSHDICLHAKVYGLGDKYGIPSLKDEALKKFEDTGKVAWEADAFCRAIRIVFTNTPDTDSALRGVVANIIHDRGRQIAGMTTIKDVVCTTEDLAYRLWEKAMNMPGGPTCHICRSVFVKACFECSRTRSKRGNVNDYFVTCHCDPHQPYCQHHRQSLIHNDGELEVSFDI